MRKLNKKALRQSLKEYLDGILLLSGENPKRDGLKETPARVARMYEELFKGYRIKDSSVFKKFDSNNVHDLVTVSNIHFYSLCEHHLLPFFGEVHIGYIPNGKVLGLSKFSRLVDIYARRLQTQENLTNQIAQSLQKNLDPIGYLVLIKAEHLCMSMRGINKKGVSTKTMSVGGLLKSNLTLQRQFFLQLNALREDKLR